MKKIIYQDMRRIIRSGGFWIAISIIIVSAIINIVQTQWYDKSDKFGAYGLFIFGCVQYNPLISYLAPFVSAIAFSAVTIIPQNGSIELTDLKKHVMGHSISSMIAGGCIFLFSFLIILAGCFIYDPSTTITYYEPLGLFKEVYYASVPLYILLFFIHSIIFGAVYALFGVGITLTAKSDAMGLVFPGVFYHIIYYIGTFFSQTIISWITVLFPVMPFNFGGLDVPLWKNALDLGVIFIISIVMILTGYRKLRKTHKISLLSD